MGSQKRVSKRVFSSNLNFHSLSRTYKGPLPLHKALQRSTCKLKLSIERIIIECFRQSIKVQFDYCLRALLQIHTNSVVSLEEFEIYKAKGESTSTGHPTASHEGLNDRLTDQ